jgi:acyl carrier protein
MPTVYDRVKRVVVDRLGVEDEDVTLEASFTDNLNADSLDLVELIMAFEEEFSQGGLQVEISDEEAEGIRTVGQAVEFLKGKGVQEE